MHVPEPSMGGDTANLIHSSAVAKPKTTDHRQSIPVLLLQPVWRAEHLKVLKVREKTQVFASAMVGKFHLPRDGRDDFEELAAELTRPTPSAIKTLSTTCTNTRNTFHQVFTSIHELHLFTTNQTSQNRYVRAAKRTLSTLIENILPYTDDAGSLRLEMNSIPFHLSKIGVNGVLSCDGCMIRMDPQGRTAPLPVVVFSVVRPHTQYQHDDVEAQEASQLVLQAALAFEQNPNLTAYKAFAVHVDGTSVQIVSADIPRVYLEGLYQGKTCVDGFDVLHSASYDMLEIEGRREVLRILFGLLKSLRARPVQNHF